MLHESDWTDEQWGRALGEQEKENAQLREQLAEAQKKLKTQGLKWHNDKVDRNKKLKVAQARIEELEGALHDLLAVLPRGNLKMKTAVLALENTLQRKKDAG